MRNCATAFAPWDGSSGRLTPRCGGRLAPDHAPGVVDLARHTGASVPIVRWPGGSQIAPRPLRSVALCCARFDSRGVARLVGEPPRPTEGARAVHHDTTCGAYDVGDGTVSLVNAAPAPEVIVRSAPAARARVFLALHDDPHLLGSAAVGKE